MRAEKVNRGRPSIRKIGEAAHLCIRGSFEPAWAVLYYGALIGSNTEGLGSMEEHIGGWFALADIVCGKHPAFTPSAHLSAL